VTERRGISGAQLGNVPDVLRLAGVCGRSRRRKDRIGGCRSISGPVGRDLSATKWPLQPTSGCPCWKIAIHCGPKKVWGHARNWSRGVTSSDFGPISEQETRGRIAHGPRRARIPGPISTVPAIGVRDHEGRRDMEDVRARRFGMVCDASKVAMAGQSTRRRTRSVVHIGLSIDRRAGGQLPMQSVPAVYPRRRAQPLSDSSRWRD